MITKQALFARADEDTLVGVRQAWGFGWRRALDAAVRGALSFGFLGTAVGGVVTEKFYHIPFSPADQWHYALFSSAVGAIIGVIWGCTHRLSE